MKSVFEYEAIVDGSQNIRGIFQGEKEEFEQMVAQKKLILTKVKEKKPKKDTSKFKQEDFLIFIEELYYLINSGMAIDSALKTLAKTTHKESYKRVLQTTLQEIKSGTLLSSALQKALTKEGLSVDSLSISFVATAEEVGSLADGLQQLFKYLSFQNKIRSDVKQALSYPLFLIGMSVVVSFMIFFLIIPRFATIFSPEEFEQLPALSYYVLSLGKYLDTHMGSVFLGMGVFGLGVYFLLKRSKLSWSSLLYRIPKLSESIIDLQLSITYSALSTMLIGGLELDKALRQLQKVKLLPELSELLSTTLFEIKRGKKMSEVFGMSSIIPPSDIALLSVGESSASLEKVFASLSTRHSEAFSAKVKKLLAILEPAVIVALGVFIAIIVVSIMMAVMSMTDIVS